METSFSSPQEAGSTAPRRHSRKFIKYPAQPKPVSEEERQHMMAVAEKNEEQERKLAKKREQEQLTQNFITYSTHTENAVNEATMLSSELIRFQKNGLAGRDSLKIYRDRLQKELATYLKSLETYASSGAFQNVDVRDKRRLDRLLERNHAALEKINEAIKESEFLENNTDAPFSVQGKFEKNDQRSVWTKKEEKPKKQNLVARAWGWIKKPSKWFS